MLCVVIEDTVRVIGERQLAALNTLAGTMAGTITTQDVCAAIESGIAGQRDMPCTLTYLFDAGGRTLSLAAKTGFDEGHPAAQESLSADAKIGLWPIGTLIANNRAITVEHLTEYLPSLPAGCWDKPPARRGWFR